MGATVGDFMKSTIPAIGKTGGIFFCRVVIICAFSLLIGTTLPVRAVTIHITTQALSASSPNLQAPGLTYNTTTGTTTPGPYPGGTTTVGATSAEATAGPATPSSGVGGTSYGYAFGDIATGILRADAEIVAADATQEAQQIASGFTEIGETFDVSGTSPGTVQAYMAVDGSYDISRL